MKPISIYVGEKDYQEFKSLSARSGRPVAELIREAMSRYLAECRRTGGSLVDLEPHESGELLRDWTRNDLMDEMLER
ncbi:MAG: ribbon-helix-helix protein, CopG family [Candidatus Eremiobacteraeota bacterium]|nr:ribbon-helix-helix protein, CopG family [Candidatus Eremiobacteraeota bacterium]